MRHRGFRALLVTVLLATVGLVTATPVLADDYDDQRAQNEARQQAIQNAADRLAAELEGTSTELSDAYAELQGIKAQIPVAEAQLAEAEANLARLQREAALIAQRLEVAEAQEAAIAEQIAAGGARVAELQDAIGQMARDAYKGDMTASTVSAMLGSATADEFIEQSEMSQVALRTQTQALHEVEEIVAVNRNQEARQVAVREQITELKAEADANVAAAEIERQRAADRKAELDALEAAAEQKAADIEKQRAQEQARMNELARQQAQLEADLKKIIAAQAAARAASGSGSTGSTASQPFINPSSVNPIYKTSDYGMRFHPVLHIWRMHAGVDLRTWCNTPIYAAASGTVLWARYRSGYGNQVMIDNGRWQGNSLMSSYNHLSSFAVSSGTHVRQGQLIAYAGNTGTSAACHLHFEVYVNGSTVNPWPLIAK